MSDSDLEEAFGENNKDEEINDVSERIKKAGVKLNNDVFEAIRKAMLEYREATSLSINDINVEIEKIRDVNGKSITIPVRVSFSIIV